MFGESAVPEMFDHQLLLYLTRDVRRKWGAQQTQGFHE
jgi:hypothetical protein